MKSSFLDNLISRLDNLDAGSMQAFVHKLVKQKGFLEVIFNAIMEGVVVINRSLSIVYYNKSAELMLGIPEEGGRNLKISTFLRDIDWARILQQDEEEWYRISRQEIEIFYPSRRIVNFYVVPHDDEGKLATIILSDITEKRKKEVENFESEKIQLISILAAGVAHEIGNPLNSLNVHLQLLDRIFKNKMDDEAKEILGVARSEVKRLDLIITQFLSAIRPAKLKMETVDLLEIVNYTLDFMHNELDEHNVKIEKTFAEIIPLVLGDENQLKQAFFNIIKNAMQAMPTGGVIAIECYVNEEKEVLSLVMSDTGSGISAEDITKVFDPYFTKKNKGTGLGLMIVERIIREHGAELLVESEPGKGTKFVMNFPLRVRKTRLLEAQKNNMDNGQWK